MIWDIDGNEYIDYAAGMGPTILGHNHPRVLAAVQQALQSGQCFAGQHELEAEFAERLIGATAASRQDRSGTPRRRKLRRRR
jgi:glutamate-1-semialdehyde 2,1-aminomutase